MSWLAVVIFINLIWGYQNTTTVITLLTGFLPPTDAHLYLPILFKLWEALNSSQLDERLLDIFATLSQEHVAGASAGIDGATPWKDVGIFTNEQWSRISRACLVAMSASLDNASAFVHS
jgi:proteasome activator subunit 4